jgi:hypothetical protein
MTLGYFPGLKKERPHTWLRNEQLGIEPGPQHRQDAINHDDAKLVPTGFKLDMLIVGLSEVCRRF